MKRILTLLLSLVLPGIGQILCGWIAVGLTFFLCEVVLVNAFIIMTFHLEEEPTSWQLRVLVACFAAIWLGCQAHLAWLLFARDTRKRHEQKELAFREGLRYYVRDELNDAVRQFQRVLRLDRFDCDARFYLGVCCSRAGRYCRAIRHLRKCSELDDDRKWALDVQEELRKARELRRLGPGRAPKRKPAHGAAG